MSRKPHNYCDVVIPVETENIQASFPVEDSYIPAIQPKTPESSLFNLSASAFFNADNWTTEAIRVVFVKQIVELVKKTWRHGQDVFLELPMDDDTYHKVIVDGVTPICLPEEKDETFMTFYFKLFKDFVDDTFD